MSLPAKLLGRRFGKLVVVKRAETNGGKTWWLCRCACGNETKTFTAALTTGEKKSCGCLRRKHGEGGGSPSKEYSTWISIKQRCYNPRCAAYKVYGAKGVTVCAPWRKSFVSFLSDIGRAPSQKHSIDRINPNLGYAPGNCRWATSKEQGENRSNSRFLVCKSEVMTVAQAARRFGIHHTTLVHRLEKYDWDLEKATEKPLRHYAKEQQAFPGEEYRSVEYKAWTAMRFRCSNPKALGYHRYGGIGIKVCKRWDMYAMFLQDMGRKPSPEHSLDRIDSTGNYVPSNCRWATRIEQANNRTSLRLHKLKGDSLTLTGWSKRTGISLGLLKSRITNGWTLERALLTPLIKPTDGARLYVFRGMQLPLREWSNRLGILLCTLEYRIKAGWPTELAFTISTNHHNRPLQEVSA